MISLIKQYPGLKDTQREVSELFDSRYSQSAAITIDEKIQLPQAGQHPDITFLLLGSLNRPDGGIYERR